MASKDWVLTNSLIPGDWEHAAIYLDGFVYEAVTHGVRRIEFSEWFYKHDYVAICRPIIPLNNTQIQKMIAFARAKIGVGYDFYFGDVYQQNPKNFYCSLFVWHVYGAGNPEITKSFTVRETLGVYTVVPQDYFNAKQKFDVLAVFNK